MKKILLVLVLSKSFILLGQQDAKTEIRSILTQMLVDDNILLSEKTRKCTENCIWKKEKEKKRILDNDERLKEKLLDNFVIPSFCIDKKINPNYIYKNKSISKLGSYIIRNNNFSSIESRLVPDLPILLTGRQLSIIDPLNYDSNYILNYTTEKLFKGQSKTGIDANFESYFTSKLEQSFNTDDNKRKNLTLAAGTFKNELASLFQRASENRITSKEFYTLYDIWVKYSLNKIFPGDFVIKAFEGLCYYQSVGNTNNSNIQSAIELDVNYKYPFLSLSSSNKINWGSYTSLKGTSETYNIYMFSKPEIIEIPKPEEILTNWKRLSNIPDATKQESDNIPNLKPLEIQVQFGPIVNPDFINNIKLDENYSLSKISPSKKFIKKIELINTPEKYTYNDGTNIVTFPIKIYRDEDFVNSYTMNDRLSQSIDLRLYYDQPVKINGVDQYLEIIYKGIPVSTELKPNPIVVDNVIKAEKNGNNYLFKFSGNFNTDQGQYISSVPKPYVSDVLNLPLQTTSNFKDRIIKTQFTLKANNNFDAIITIPSEINVFSSNNREMNIELVIKFTDSKNNFSRKVPIILLAHDEQIKTDPISALPVIFNSTESLLASLNDDAKFNDGVDIKTLKDKYIEITSGRLNVNDFIEEFKKKADIIISPEGKYLVKPIFIDNEKLKNK